MVDGDALRGLQEAAKNAVAKAYCPYSGFRVGAAVLTSDGRVFEGANVENVSFGLTVCAERTAIFQAVLAGAKSLAAIAIYTPTAAPTAPCGSCRQVLREFAPAGLVCCFCDGPDTLHRSVNDLLPDSFGPEVLSAVTSRSTSRPSRERPRICIDIDNVVAQTDEVMRAVIRKITKERVVLEYKHITTFNYWECHDDNGNAITRDEWKEVHDRFSESEWLNRIQPVADVQESLRRLSEKYILHFATSRLAKARRTTIEWLEQNGFPDHDIHFLKHGEKHISLGAFDVSVEDDPTQALAFAAAGFGLNFVIEHPWNAGIADAGNLRRVAGWREIEKALAAREV